MGAALGPIIGAAVGVVKQGKQEREHAKALEVAVHQQRLAPLLNPGGSIRAVEGPGSGPSLFNNIIKGAIAGQSIGAQMGEDKPVTDTVAATPVQDAPASVRTSSLFNQGQQSQQQASLFEEENALQSRAR